MASVSDYQIVTEDGTVVTSGDKLSTYDGREAVFETITRAPEGKYAGLILTDLGEHNPAVYNLTMVLGETEAQRIAQDTADLHFRIAASPDNDLAASDSAVYRSSFRLVLNAVMTGYGLARPKAESVYAVMRDNGGTMAEAVQVVATTKPADLPKL